VTIRAAFPSWPHYNNALRDTVAALSDEQLGVVPGPDRWPLWATIGHLGCQRVSSLCGFLEEPGAESTPYPNAFWECPGDEDLVNVLDAQQLVTGIDTSFAIVERCLDTWTYDMLDEVIRRDFDGDIVEHTRGWVLQRSLAHDVSHCTEINEALTTAGLSQINLWRESD
jgi:hypothetical protein